MTFRSLISEDELGNNRIEKIYTKLLAFGIRDFTKVYQIIEIYNNKSQKFKDELESNSIDLLVYEYLSQNKIFNKDFDAKHILSLTYSDNGKENDNSNKMLASLDKAFPQKTKVSSMTPNPIHFGPLEGFLSGSFSNIDLRTLMITIGFWMTIYGLIFYFLYL